MLASEKDANEQRMSRRDCLTWLASASALALAGLNTSVWAEDDGAAGAVKIADLIRFPSGTVKLLASPKCFVSRTAKGVACMSTICTHRKSDLDLSKDGEIYCPVHGSTFDGEGNSSGGPANRPLTWYATTISDAGAISVDTASTVKQGQWAELPAWAKPKEKAEKK